MSRKIFFLMLLIIASGSLAQNLSKDSIEQKSSPPYEQEIEILLKAFQKAKTDTSKVNLLNAIANQYPLDQSDKIKKYGDSALAIAIKINWSKGQAEALNNISDALSFEGKIKEAIEKNLAAVELFEAINNQIGIANSYRKIGIAFFRLSDFTKSFEYFSRALKIFQSLDNQEGIGKSLSHIAALYGTFGNDEKALEYFLHSLATAERMGNQYEAAIQLGNIGVTYENLKKYDLAINYYKKAITISREIEDWYNFTTFTGNIGNVYVELKKYSKAQEYYQLSIKYASQSGNDYGVAYQHGNLGKLMYKMAADSNLNLTDSERKNNYLKSFEYLNLAVNKLKTLGIKDEQKYFLLILSDAYEEFGDYKKALASFKSAKELQDSIFSEKNKKLISEMEIKQQLDLKEKEVLILSKERDYKEKTNILLGLLAFVFVVVSIAVFGFYLKKRKDNAELSENIRIRKETENALLKNEEELRKHKNQLEDLVRLRTENLENEISEKIKLIEEKEILLKELNHRVKNNLQIISSLLYLQSLSSRDKETAGLFEDSRNRVRSMALIHEELYQSTDFTEIKLKEYVKNLTTFSKQSFRTDGVEIKIDVDIDNEITLDLDTAISCGLIINEILTNSYKYAFPIEWMNKKPKGYEFKIFVGVKAKSENQFELTVSDNGVGIDKELDFENTPSLGLKIIASMAKQLEGKLEINNNIGLEFKISFDRSNRTV